MKHSDKVSTSLSQPSVVGTVISRISLAAGRKLSPADCDLLELRIDNFLPDSVAPLLRAAPALPLPFIVTVRHPSEGGVAASITARQRRSLYIDFLPHARFIDIELRFSSGEMKHVMRDATAAGVGIILSHHDFKRTPTAVRLRDLARRAQDAGATVFKVAAMTHTPRDLAYLMEFLAIEKQRLPLAVMGMGVFGKVSRLALAQAGSCLNYGFIGKANASGQWPVRLLKSRIAEL